jgi:glycosyltransferase involved in cell wall biosynthesis
MQPLVSVVITNYNYGRFLRQCIDSVKAQSYDSIEIIVVDDGSTDDSRAVLESCAGIRAIFQANRGQAGALSAGVAASSGEIICLLDADDGWYPNKVARVVEVFNREPDVLWLRHKLAMVSEELEPMHAVVPAFKGSAILRPEPVLLLEGLITAGTTLALRRSLATRVFPLVVPQALALDADDMILLARIVATGTSGYSLDEVLGYYRRHLGERFGGHDLVRLLSREAALSEGLASLFEGESVPTSVYKIRSVTAALEGARPWHAARLGNFLKGMKSALGLWQRPRLCARQSSGLILAYVAPGAWVEKLRRAQPFAPPRS